MKLRLMEFFARIRGRTRKTAWIGGLSREQRRTLASNLRDLTESKRALERHLNGNAPRA